MTFARRSAQAAVLTLLLLLAGAAPALATDFVSLQDCQDGGGDAGGPGGAYCVGGSLDGAIII